jgi:hypothetical protein
MTDDVLHSDVCRDLRTGLGTLAIGGVAAALVGRAGLVGADTYASSGRVAGPLIWCIRRQREVARHRIRSTAVSTAIWR